MSLKVGSLFAGYGGLELALSSVIDCEPAWFSEFDKAPSRILAHHWPTVPNLGDVTRIDWNSVEPVDIITGGSPCQDLSHAGKRKGMKAGTRSGLWASMCDAIDIIRPRLVVWENVRGALSAEADSGLEQCPGCVGDPDDGAVLRALGRVLGDLADIGYDARWYGLRAADVGAAHGRFRIFLFATPADAQHDGWIAPPQRRSVGAGTEQGRMLEPQGSPTGPALTLLPTPAVNDMGAAYTPDTWDEWTAKMQAAHGNGNGTGGPDLRTVTALLPTPDANMGNGGRRRSAEALAAGDHQVNLNDLPRLLLPTPRATDGTNGGPNQRGSSGDLMLPSAVMLLLPTPTVAALLPTPNASDWKGPNHSGSGAQSANGLSTITEELQDWREYEAAIRRQEVTFGRPAPMPTEPGAKGQPRLSPRFVEWLMALPEGHVTDVPGISRNDQLKALGNGVVPQQAAAAFRAFLHDTAREAVA